MKIQTDELEINCESVGEGDCLVLIHGFTDNLSMWYNQIPELSKKYRVLTYDVRGHGQIGFPKNGVSMDLFADDLHRLLSALDIDKACVLGYSMGGRIGANFALKYPKMTTGLIFANSGIPGPALQWSEKEIAEMEQRRSQMLGLLETGDNGLIADVMAEFSFSPGFREKAPEIFQKYKDVKLKNDPRHYILILHAIADSFENPPDLGRLECPVLILAGEKDLFMSMEIARSMEAAIPNVRMKTFPTGHAAPIEMPDPFNQAVLEFLEGLFKNRQSLAEER